MAMDRTTDFNAEDFEPARKLAQDRERVRRRFKAKFKRFAAKLPFAEDLLAAYYCAFDRQTPRHVQFSLLAEDDPAAFAAWRSDWDARKPDLDLAARANPVRIPRNHRIQQVIDAGVAGDFQPFHRLNRALATPFDADPEWDDLCLSPKAGEEVRVTFCGT